MLEGECCGYALDDFDSDPCAAASSVSLCAIADEMALKRLRGSPIG